MRFAESLYFGFAPYMEQEPQRILRDEGIAGLNAVAVLEAVGRGAEGPSEIASRLGTAQLTESALHNCIDSLLCGRTTIQLSCGGLLAGSCRLIFSAS